MKFKEKPRPNWAATTTLMSLGLASAIAGAVLLEHYFGLHGQGL